MFLKISKAIELMAMEDMRSERNLIINWSVCAALDLGYRYSRNTWGRGIGTEAAQAVVEYGLKELGLLSIVGGVLHENIASEKILIKLGFIFEAEAYFMGKLFKKYILTS